MGLRPYLEDVLTVSNTSTQIPAASLSINNRRIEAVDIFVENGAVRMRLDGTAPTATVGVLRERGYSRRLNAFEANQARFIRDTDQAENVTIRLTFHEIA